MAIIEIAGNKTNEPVSLISIAQSQNISLSYLEQIFAYLRKAGIVDAIKGAKGGYILAKNRKEITISQIIRAIGEPIKMTRCTAENKGCMGNKVKCKTHHLWQGLENRIFDYLDSISLENL